MIVMLETLLIIIGGLCLLAGFSGCVLPALPGPPVAYLGLVLLHLTEKHQFSTAELVIWLLLVVVIHTAIRVYSLSNVFFPPR